jgi:HEAT repeat protein
LRIELQWSWPLVVAFTLYVLTGAAVIVSRIRYERRRRLLARLDGALGDHPEAARDSDLHDVAGISSGTARRLVFERRASERSNEALARFIVKSVGLKRVTDKALGHGRAATRWKRIGALRLLALATHADALPVLEAALEDDDVEIRAAAAATLGNIADERAAVLLVRSLDHSSFAPSRLAAFIDHFPVDVPDALRPLLAGTASASRYWGAVLCHRYPGLPWIEDELVRLSSDPTPTVRKAAIQSLAALGSQAGVKVASAALTDPVPYVRAHAARALGAFGACEQAGQVTGLLADRDWWVRQAAKDALVRMGQGAEDEVIACLSHPDRFARNSAAEILQNTGVFERLLAQAAAGKLPQGDNILKLLREAGGPRLTQAVVERLQGEVRERAASALRALGEAKANL